MVGFYNLMIGSISQSDNPYAFRVISQRLLGKNNFEYFEIQIPIENLFFNFDASINPE